MVTITMVIQTNIAQNCTTVTFIKNWQVPATQWHLVYDVANNPKVQINLNEATVVLPDVVLEVAKTLQYCCQ